MAQSTLPYDMDIGVEEEQNSPPPSIEEGCAKVAVQPPTKNDLVEREEQKIAEDMQGGEVGANCDPPTAAEAPAQVRGLAFKFNAATYVSPHLRLCSISDEFCMCV